jgi:hypothetical protein
MNLKPPFSRLDLRALARNPFLWVLVVFVLVLSGAFAMALTTMDAQPPGTPTATEVAQADQAAGVASPEPAQPTPEPPTPTSTAQATVEPTPQDTPASATAKPSSTPKPTQDSPEAPRAQASSRGQADFTHPWPRTGKHAEAPCASCHVGSEKPSTSCGSCHNQPEALHAQAPHNVAACETCHQAPGVEWSVATQTCVTCHSDRQQHFPMRECGSCHAFKPGAATFQHPVELPGKHPPAACSSCHTSAEKPATSCSSCHQQTGGALHAAGTHAGTACATCHGTASVAWTGVDQQACGSCHADKQSHYAGITCSSCHAFSAKGTTYQHAWALSGKHQSVACKTCHTSAAKPDPNCSSCHKTTGGGLHAADTHTKATCQSCHGTASTSWKGVNQQSCTGSCHTNKSEHYPSQSCSTCHSFTGQPASYKHAWPLSGKHAETACKTCHTSAAKPDPNCASCHKQSAGLHAEEPHAGTACATCHGTASTGWKGVTQQTCTSGCHKDRTEHFPALACASCHSFTGQTVNYNHAWPLSGKHAATGCESCHTSAAKPDPNCATCHKTTGGGLHTKEPHTKTACQSCHGTAATGWSGVNQQSCLSCHGDRSSHFSGSSCQSCHAFTPNGTNFQHTAWPLSGKHQSASCDRCHTSSAKPSTSCTACHKAPTVELHRKEAHTRNSCQTCHGTTFTGWAVERQTCLNCHAKDYAEKDKHQGTTALCQSCHRFK